MGDDRVEPFAARILLAVYEGADDDAVFQETGDDPLIGHIQNATIDYRTAAAYLLAMPGYLILDPNEALVERIAESLYDAAHPVHRPWAELGNYDRDWVREQYRGPARAVLAALLSGDPSAMSDEFEAQPRKAGE